MTFLKSKSRHSTFIELPPHTKPINHVLDCGVTSFSLCDIENMKCFKVRKQLQPCNKDEAIKQIIMGKVIGYLIVTAYSTQFMKKMTNGTLFSKLAETPQVGYSFMSSSAVSETLKHSAYSCVPTCTDTTSAKANTGLSL